MDPEEEIRRLKEHLYRVTLEKDLLARSHEALIKQHDIKISPTVKVQYPDKPILNKSLRAVFLGGPLTSDNWQKEVTEKLEGKAIIVVNPRKDEWQMSKVEEQVAWEIEYLEQSHAIFFWFSWDHPNIEATLLELGRCTATKGVIFVGVHDNVKQKRTIYEFIRMYAPHVAVSNTMEKVVSQMMYWVQNGIMKSGGSRTGSSSGSSSSGSSESGSSLSGSSVSSKGNVTNTARRLPPFRPL